MSRIGRYGAQGPPARQTLPDYNLPCRIDPMNLEDCFRDI
jgi:hypothetical protein